MAAVNQGGLSRESQRKLDAHGVPLRDFSGFVLTGTERGKKIERSTVFCPETFAHKSQPSRHHKNLDCLISEGQFNCLVGQHKFLSSRDMCI